MTKDNTEDDINEDVEFVQEDGEGTEITSKDKIKQLREELKKSKAEGKENLEGWQRARADYINLQKSSDAERGEIRKRAQTELILEILPNLDHFDSAMSNTEVWEKVDEKWRRGIEYIRQQLHKTLEDYGVAEITEAKIFNPEIHEPLEIEETDDESKDHEIIKVMQKGYKLHDKVIRPAKVKMYQFKK